MFSQDFTCPDLLIVTHINSFRVRDYHPLWSDFPNCSTNMINFGNWADPLSLAATNGISVDFFSSGYLDVSVPQVRLITLCIQIMILTKESGFPHSEISGSKLICQLPEAYRRLPRPSSPPIA